ncbi:hypothetical protein SAMN05421788_1011230 [Filimonas lacunae]|uniref:Uncharacterized protein n=1 Tax=Filimonas lacunae TaxID=477680 RepID=A0A173MR36_9BACT|nr:DUF5522 domain-containing protein [Filimonas lacunae]BAV09798.1 hypothetical protein FLA_5851 [Filimonas lacunae]SIS79098.1 hypothetical protein SAMN05421788_1011230 [Filimonas lacunae]
MSQKLIEDVDFYFNEEGLMVLTSTFHLKRGVCCGNGCLHCPYEYEKVPEPKRSQLLLQRARNSNPATNSGTE